MSNSEKLTKKLREIEDDNDFVFCVSKMAKTEDEKAQILKYIEIGKDVSYETIILMAVDIARNRNAKKHSIE